MDITGLNPAVKALEYMEQLLKDPSKIVELVRTVLDPCDPDQPIETCIDDICQQNGGRIPQKLPKNARDFLNAQVQGLMKSNQFLSMFGKPGAIMRAFLEGQNDSICKPDNVQEMTTFAIKTAQAPAAAGAANSDKFSIDAVRAAVLTSGARLVYDVLTFGSAVCPTARPATQGLMVLFGFMPPPLESPDIT